MSDSTHEAPERIWITSDGIWYDFDPSEACDPVSEYVRADRIEELEKALTEKMLSELSALGQAQEAYERQLELEAVLSDVDAWVDDLGMYAQEGPEPATVFKRVKEVLNK